VWMIFDLFPRLSWKALERLGGKQGLAEGKIPAMRVA